MTWGPGPSVRERGGSRYLVVIIEETQSIGAVLIPIHTHHGLGGNCQRVFQEGSPGIVFLDESLGLAIV